MSLSFQHATIINGKISSKDMLRNPIAKRFSFKKFGKLIEHNWKENGEDVAKIWHKATEPIVKQGKKMGNTYKLNGEFIADKSKEFGKGTLKDWKDDGHDIKWTWDKAGDGLHTAGDWLDGTSRGITKRRIEDKATAWSKSASIYSQGKQDGLIKRWGLHVEDYLAAEVVGKPTETKHSAVHKSLAEGSTRESLTNDLATSYSAEETTSSLEQ